MSQFEEPTILAALDRSFGDRKEELRLEQGEYQGKPTYTLRLCWQGQDQKWRWSQAKPSASSGKCWQQLNVRAGELEALGTALIRAARGEVPDSRQQQAKAKVRSGTPTPVFAGDDDIPF
jgi:hypothetical protein